MSRLKRLLAIKDDKARLKELISYAHALNADLRNAKNKDNTYSENKLAVLIYEREESLNYRKSVDRVLVLLGIVIVIFLILVIRMVLFMN